MFTKACDLSELKEGKTDVSARYVAITTPDGALVHEASYYKNLADLEKAGIRAALVPDSHPWGTRKDGF